MNQKPDTIGAFNKRAQQYQERYMPLDWYDQSYLKLLELIDKQGAKLLELGSGPGMLSRFLLNHRSDLQLTVTDLAPEMLRLAAQNLPQARCELFDAKNLADWPEKMDVICAGFLLPYLSAEELNDFLKAAFHQLHPSGLLYFSFMDDDYSKSGIETTGDGQDQFEVWYHPTETVREQLGVIGFELMHEQVIVDPEWKRPGARQQIMISRKV